MPRALFEKKEPAIWISHLDLMRLLQRAFKRAGLPLTHSNGFNPRPSVSIALPLSVGVESDCELLLFDLETDGITNEEILSRINEKLVAGICVKSVYDSDRKIKDLSYLRCRIELEYDSGVPAGATAAIQSLFTAKSICVERKTKNGNQTQDIAPMIREFIVSQDGDEKIILDTVICCQNPTLNPALIITAITDYLPQYAPSFGKCCRKQLYDAQMNVFR